MAAAIMAAKGGARVTVLERMDRVGKKLLATGNGRCNLMNRGQQSYPGGGDFARQVLARYGAAEQECFWRELGLRLREEDGGRVYPVSGQASSVLDALRLGMERAGVQTETGVAVDALRRGKDGFTIGAGDRQWQAERVILAGGGCAQPKLGSDGSLWPLAQAMGHHLRTPRPALTQITTDTAPIRGLGGIRVKAEVTAMRGGRVVHQEAGEVLFADYGVSGVCVMGTARYVDKGCTLRINMLPGMDFADGQEAQEVTREKEILRAKTRVHDEIGRALLQTRQLLAGTQGDTESVCSAWRQNVRLLLGKYADEQRADAFEQLSRAAQAIGVTIERSGVFPEDGTEAAQLAEAAAHECLTNLVRHAGGTRLEIIGEKTESGWRIRYLNDGKAPSGPIVEGSGLTALRARTEAACGAMETAHEPRFQLTLILPAERQVPA